MFGQADHGAEPASRVLVGGGAWADCSRAGAAGPRTCGSAFAEWLRAGAFWLVGGGGLPGDGLPSGGGLLDGCGLLGGSALPGGVAEWLGFTEWRWPSGSALSGGGYEWLCFARWRVPNGSALPGGSTLPVVSGWLARLPLVVGWTCSALPSGTWVVRSSALSGRSGVPGGPRFPLALVCLVVFGLSSGAGLSGGAGCSVVLLVRWCRVVPWLSFAPIDLPLSGVLGRGGLGWRWFCLAGWWWSSSGGASVG
jgi:hypothetical protein